MIFDLGSHCYRRGFTDFQRETRGIRRRLYYNPQRGGVAEKGATRVEKHEGGLVMSQSSHNHGGIETAMRSRLCRSRRAARYCGCAVSGRSDGCLERGSAFDSVFGSGRTIW